VAKTVENKQTVKTAGLGHMPAKVSPQTFNRN